MTTSPDPDRPAGRSARAASTGVVLFFLLAATGAPTTLAGGPDADESRRAFHRGDYERAAALATAEIAAHPRDVAAQVVLARAQAALGRFDLAFLEFQKALRLAPGNQDALYYLGITSSVLAQAEYERLFTLAPDSARAHQLLGETLLAQEKTAEAERELQAALAKSPRSVELLVALGDLNRKTLHYPEAASYYERARDLAPGNYDVLYGLGVCHTFRGQQAQAIALFREALRREPGSPSARLALGIALLQTGQPAEAAKELEAAAAAEPGMRQAHYQLGRAYQALGRTKEAEAAFARVQEIVKQQLTAEGSVLEPDPQ
jgi:cytochrome c-type biogenesis protein CcmH/NrfG